MTLNYRNRKIDKAVRDSLRLLDSSPTNELDPEALTKPAEIRSSIKRLKNYKAPGPDQIPNVLLKNLPLKAIVFITYILNACLYLSYFPDSWKEAIVTAVTKPEKDLSNPASYRLISLINALSKIFEKIMLNRIDKNIETSLGFNSGSDNFIQRRIKHLE